MKQIFVICLLCTIAIIGKIEIAFAQNGDSLRTTAKTYNPSHHPLKTYGSYHSGDSPISNIHYEYRNGCWGYDDPNYVWVTIDYRGIFVDIHYSKMIYNNSCHCYYYGYPKTPQVWFFYRKAMNPNYYSSGGQ